MAAATARKPGRRKTSPKRQQELAVRKAEIEAAAEAVEDDAPDFAAFLARWGDRYSHNNLRRLWVQYPRATSLHKYGTWQAMGRQVRAGEKAILLRQPHVSTDPELVTPENPNGEVFHGAPWMALFDYAQTDPIGEFTDAAPEDADPGLVAEVKRLRKAALAEHPDAAAPNTGPDDEAFLAACARFQVAWKRYEEARARLRN